MTVAQSPQVTVDKVAWRIPKRYLRHKVRSELNDVRRKVNVPRLVVIALAIVVITGATLTHYFPSFRREIIIKVILALPVAACYLGLIVLQAALQGLAEGKVTLSSKGVRKGSRLYPWGTISSYQLSGVAEFQDLRALEISHTNRGREATILCPFDPQEIDEAAIASFLNTVAPEKHWRR